MEMPPEKRRVLEMLDAHHRDMLRGYMAMEQRAKVNEERAKAAESRLLWWTRGDQSGDGETEGTGDAAAQRERIHQLLRENEQVHAQLAAARVQLSEVGRSTAERDCRIAELENHLERATRAAVATQAQQQRDQQQIRSLRASVRALEKELIESTSRYR